MSRPVTDIDGDCVTGVPDLKAGLLRLIGDPETRFREDPVRMLRAVRFAAKLGFRIEEKTAAVIPELAPLLAEFALLHPRVQFDIRFDYEAYTAADALIGHAGITVFDDTADMGAMARFAVDVGIHGIPVPRKVRVGERTVVSLRHHQERPVDRDALRPDEGYTCYCSDRLRQSIVYQDRSPDPFVVGWAVYYPLCHFYSAIDS